MTFERYSGTAAQYICEYLIPYSSAEYGRVSSEQEARQMWASLEDEFRDGGGTGIDEDEFVEAMLEMAGVDLRLLRRFGSGPRHDP